MHFLKAINLKAVNPMKAFKWLLAHRAELQHALRVGIAAIISLYVVHLLNLTQGYWTILTAVLVVQSSVGGSMKFAVDRMIGTVGGAVYGAVIAAFIFAAQDGISRYLGATYSPIFVIMMR